MRARCEGCGEAQPADWKSGDLCSTCGKSVRHEIRCYWCAKWVPAAKFCRSCGAGRVEDRLFGAARMLKEAGTDRFSIPQKLLEFDGEQIENFSRIYQRHAIAVARHVDEVRFLEGFLHQRHWSAELEERLIPQLPWNEETLAQMSGPSPRGEGLPAILEIQQNTPFEVTRILAALARVRLGDGGAFEAVRSALFGGDPSLRHEAALALARWPIWARFGKLRDLERPLLEILEASSFKVEAAVGLGLLGRQNPERLREALDSRDSEVAFGAALVLGDIDRLRSALQGDALQQSVAGNKLIQLGVLEPVVGRIKISPLEVQRDLVDSLLRRKEPAPEAASTLLEIIEGTRDPALRERAARLVCRELPPDWAIRIARAAAGDRAIFQSLLRAEQPPSTLEALADFMVNAGLFTLSQYGLPEVAEEGKLPASFVPTRFLSVPRTVQLELLRFAELQLRNRQDESLHRFILNVVFGPFDGEIRAAAWWVLHRGYREQGDPRGEGPLRLQKASILRFFESLPQFLEKLSAVLRDRGTLKQVGVYEFVAHLLSTADGEFIAATHDQGGVTDGLVGALVQAVGEDYWPNTLEAMAQLLSQIGVHPRWREAALYSLKAMNRPGNYSIGKAIRRVELSAYGIPEESEWARLPADFFASRFGSADVQGQRELLKVLEHRLIYADPAQIDSRFARFLLDTAFRPGEAEIRKAAICLFADRIPRILKEFRLRRAEVERCYGPFSNFLDLLSGALTDPAFPEEEKGFEFLELVLDPSKSPDAGELAAQGDAGLALIRALLFQVGAGGRTSRQFRFRREVLRYLAAVGAQPAWREEVLRVLDQHLKLPGFDLAAECHQTASRLGKAEIRRPPAADPSEPPAGPPAKSPLIKHEIAQQMGRELQQAMAQLMAGPASAEEKMREASRMSQEFQAKIKDLYRT